MLLALRSLLWGAPPVVVVQGARTAKRIVSNTQRPAQTNTIRIAQAAGKRTPR